MLGQEVFPAFIFFLVLLQDQKPPRYFLIDITADVLMTGLAGHLYQRLIDADAFESFRHPDH